MGQFYPKNMTLRKRLQQLAIEAEKQPLTVGDGLQRLTSGVDGFGVPLLLLALPAALPIPISFGFKSLLGVVVVLLGLQMCIGKHSVWLPNWFTRIQLHPKLSLQAARIGERFLPRLERFVKPRMSWMGKKSSMVLLGVAVISLGFVMILSIIPGAKILAAIILITLSIGMLEKDGLLTLLAANAAVILLALHVEIVYLLVVWLQSWNPKS